MFDEFIDELDDVPLAFEFAVPVELLAVELGLLIVPLVFVVLLVLLSELVLWARAAPPATPIAPMATAVSFKIAFIIHLLEGVG